MLFKGRKVINCCQPELSPTGLKFLLSIITLHKQIKNDIYFAAVISSDW